MSDMRRTRKMLRGCAATAVAVLPLLVAGCSASSGVTPGPGQVQGGLSRALRLTVNWPPTGRAYNAPTAALSAQFILVGAAPDGRGGNVSFSVDRGVDPAGGEQTYTLDIPTANGDFPVNVDYYSAPGGAAGGGVVVGEYNRILRILPDRNGVADITPGGFINPNAEGDLTANRVSSVEVSAGQVVTVGQAPVELVFVARDVNGGALPLGRDKVVFRAVSTDAGQFVTLAPDGTATGVAPGTVRVTATVNGVTSPAVDVTVSTGRGDLGVTLQ